MIRILLAALGGVGVVALVLLILLQWARADLRAARAELGTLRFAVASCDARVRAIERAREAGREVDALGDDDLRRAVPGRWLLPPPGGGRTD